MSSLTLTDKELFVYSKEGSWNKSLESILTQKIGKLTKSDSHFNFPVNFKPNLTFSELELKEAHLRSLKSKQPKWELCQKLRFPRLMRAKSLLRDELEMLRINMPAQDKITTPRLSRELFMKPKKREKRNRKLSKHFRGISSLRRKLTLTKVKDLLTEIEGSDSVKTDTVIWKFLKRHSSFKREFINARQLIIELQALHYPVFRKTAVIVTILGENLRGGSGFECLSNLRLNNTHPVKITCPNCRFYITTRVKEISTVRTRVASFILAVLRICFHPHAVYTFKDYVHLCPLCKIYLGFCPAFGIRNRRSNLIQKLRQSYQKENFLIDNDEFILAEITQRKMVSASSTSAKNLFVESKLRLSDRVQVNVNNIAAITRQIQRGSKANENLIAAAKNFALQEAAIENSETNLKKLKLLLTHINNQLDSLHNSTMKMEYVLEQVRSMQR